jgi:hypothetical protein
MELDDKYFYKLLTALNEIDYTYAYMRDKELALSDIIKTDEKRLEAVKILQKTGQRIQYILSKSSTKGTPDF